MLKPEESTTLFQRLLLWSLNRPRAAHRPAKHVYSGTTPAHVKARRRARNKMARQSRRANRK